MQTHYDVLGVTWKASDDELRTAFRRSVKACHPDLHAGDRTAERKLRQVLAAYDVLKKPRQRLAYDLHLRFERRAKFQRVALTAFTGLVCTSVIATLMLWLPKMQDADASALRQPVAIATAIVNAPESTQVAVVDNGARAEVNSGSKSDRIAAAPSRHADASGLVQRAANPRPTPARRTEAQPRPAKEWGQVRTSDDPMAIAAFAARHPDASESKLARSKLIGLIDAADDVTLLNILGLGAGDIAERAQQRLTRLHAMAHPKEDASPSDSLKERAAGYVTARVAGWSTTNAIDLAAHTSAYADEVLYNGSRKTRQALVREKRRLLELWPERLYEVRPDSVTVRCLANVCKVGGIVDWQTRSAPRAAKASGAARFEYEVAQSRGTFRILSESSSDIKRPREAAACSKKDGETAATSSRGIRELHRDAARCLQMAGKTSAAKTSAAKLKNALLAQAQILQRAQEQRAQDQAQTQIVTTFAERWMREASLR